MNRKLLNGLLVLAVGAGGVGTFTSCKDENFADDIRLDQVSLQAQIDAIRAVTDSEFRDNLETWLNGLTDAYSDNGWKSYADLVGAAEDMYTLYTAIMAGELPESLYPFVDTLYNFIESKYIKASDWYAQIYTNKQDIADLKARLDSLQLNQQNRVSSIEVNQTFNPMFGSINVPVGLKTTVLASYVVKTSNEYNFPTGVTSNVLPRIINDSPDFATNYWPTLNTIKNVLQPKGMMVENGNYTYVEDLNYGNMGSAYLTVNPTSVDLTNGDYAIELVNSLGEPVVDADCMQIGVNKDLLSFGYTRDGENTGIYKLNVNAKPDHFNGVTIDLKDDAVDFATDVKNFIKNKSITNLAYIGEEIYKKLNGRIPAYGVKISWNEEEQAITDGENEETKSYTNSVMSNLDLAVAAVHPLSYGLDIEVGLGDAGLSDKRLPVWSSLDEILAKIENKLHLNYKDIEGLEEVNIELNVELVTETGDAGTLTYLVYTFINDKGETQTAYFLVNPDGFGVADPEAQAQLNQFVQGIVTALNAEINGSLNNQIINDLNASIQEINDQLAKYNAKLGDFTKYVKEHKAYDYASKLYQYYAKVAEKINDFIKNPNHYLQVMAIYSDGEGHYHHLSTNPGVPTVVSPKDANDAIEILASSYTGDLLAPSYLKYVAITEVDGQPATKAINDAAGEFVNVVFPGQNHRVPVKVGDSTMAGHTLTLTYMSVDYSGVTSMQNYYIYVAK